MCSGGAGLAPEDRAEILAILASDADEAMAARAKNALLTQPAEPFVAALAPSRTGADPRLFQYCALHLSEKPGIADALAKNTACPTVLVARVTRFLSPEGIQGLLDDLDRLSSDPALAAAMKLLQSCTPEQRDLVVELEGGAPAIADFEEAAIEAEPDVRKRQSLLQRVSTMNVVGRIQLALKGGREERMLMIRDSNKIVQRAVLQSPRLTDSEVEAFAAMANLTGEVLRMVSMARKFMKNYVVAKNLVKNPKTPLDISLHLLPRLNATDLKILTTSKNIPETLRSTALKLHRQRNQKTG
ncbi:MAG: hypothetical protein WBS18_04410 [Candidatus Acidiferrales bacterium]